MQRRRRARNAAAWVSGSGAELEGRVVVVSPHLDDGVLSLGAALARSAARGNDVRVLTVLAGDPGSELPAGPWDARAGFATAGQAARARRLEDEAACGLVGAQPHWLPFADHQYPRDDDEAIVAAVRQAVADADVVLLPGSPLMHEDHVRVRSLLAGALPVGRVGQYVEQPYTALWTPGVADSGVRWESAAGGAAAQLAKARAAREYRSQLAQFGARRPVYGILRYEALHGGEAFAWLEPDPGPLP